MRGFPLYTDMFCSCVGFDGGDSYRGKFRGQPQDELNGLNEMISLMTSRLQGLDESLCRCNNLKNPRQAAVEIVGRTGVIDGPRG